MRQLQVSFRNRLDSEGRRRRDRRIFRCALLHPTNDETPWKRLYASKDDPSMITVTGFDHASFALLLQPFKELFSRYTPYSENGEITVRHLDEPRGRPRSIQAPCCLALTLMFTRTKGSMFLMQTFFGLTGTPLSLWLHFGKRILLAVLKSKKDIAIKMPPNDMLHQYANIIKSHYPVLTNHYCVVDGLKLPIEQSGDVLMQSRFFNGWTHGHYVTNLFGFAPDGMIIFVVLNVPGTFHDSTMAEVFGVYKKLELVFDETGLIAIMDSAFAAGNYEFILKSSQNYNVTRSEDAQGMQVMSAATSMRQAAEWGMRAMQSSFPRLTDKFPYEDGKGERLETLKLCSLLYNFRCKYVGLNQLRNTFVVNWSKDALYMDDD